MDKQKSKNDLLLESAIQEKLKLTYEQRIEGHEKALKLLLELKLAGEQLRAGSNKAS